MADSKISDLTELTITPAATDELEIVDKSDTGGMGASGTNKRITYENLFPVLGYTGPIPAGPVASFVPGAQAYLAHAIRVFSAATVTGVRYRVGATAAGNARAALYDVLGATRLANATAALAQSTANQVQAVPFDATYDAAPGIYLLLVHFSGGTATAFGGRLLGAVATGTNTNATPTTVSPSVQNIDVPVMTLY